MGDHGSSGPPVPISLIRKRMLILFDQIPLNFLHLDSDLSAEKSEFRLGYIVIGFNIRNRYQFLNYVITEFSFRRQHEQLRAVIMRVLRPVQSSVGSSGSGKEIRQSKEDDVMIDMADANAVNEVDMAYDNMKEVDGLDVSKEGTEVWEASLKR